MTKWVEGRITENIHWNDNLFTLKIDAPVAEFTAGQYTSLALDINGESVARPYSYLSAPHEYPLEFFFYTVADGKLSVPLAALQPGDSVLVNEKAKGFFTMNQVPESRDLWMLATGTGIAPYLSILKTGEPWKKHDNIILVQAVRTLGDLQYNDLIQSIKKTHGARFLYQPFVSRESVPGTIQGRIPGAIESGELEAAMELELTPEHSQVMLCGNPAMVEDASEVLKVREFTENRRRDPGHITTENYW